VFVVRYASTGQQALGASLRELTRRENLPVCVVLNQCRHQWFALWL